MDRNTEAQDLDIEDLGRATVETRGIPGGTSEVSQLAQNLGISDE